MPRKRLGDGRKPTGTYVSGFFTASGIAGIHAVRVEGRPFLAIVTGKPSNREGPLDLVALTVAPNGLPDLVEGTVAARPDAEAIASAVAKACLDGSADIMSVNLVTRCLTASPRLKLGLPSSLITNQGLSPEEALNLAETVPTLMAQAGFPKAFLDAMDVLRAIPSGNRDLRKAVFEGSDAFRAACLSYPFLAEARWWGGISADESGLDPLRAMSERQDEDTVSLSAPVLRRIRGLDSDDFFPGYENKPLEWGLHLLGHIPPDWIPSDEDGLLALGETSVLLTLAEEGTITDTPTLVAGSKGDWPGFLRRCRSAAGNPSSLSSACKDLKDLPEFLRNRLVLPLLARTGDGDASLAGRIAADWIYADKTLPGALEASNAWHVNLASYEAGLPDIVGPDEAWETPFEQATVGGLAFVPLRTGRELREEGSKWEDRNGVPGLAHCVGSYKAEARLGACHIVSIRRLTETGYERVATAEFAQPEAGPAEIVQVRGLRNADPEPEVMSAVEAYAERARQAWPAQAEEGVDPFQAACGYDWTDDAAFAVALETLRPLLPRRLRGLDEQGLLAEAHRCIDDLGLRCDAAVPGGW